MALYSNPSPEDARRGPPVRSVRRTLPTARRAGEPAPPRVVLHLPDLEALSAVALGPPKPGPHRRIDAAHATPAGPTRPRPAAVDDGDASTASDVGPTLTTLLKEPLRKLVPQLAANPQSLGQWIVLLQQPKVLLAAVVAVGLQLAAVLAMITGQKETSPAAHPPGAHEVAEGRPAHVSGGRQPLDFGRPIQTPISAVPGALPTDGGAGGPAISWSMPAGSAASGPIVVAHPAAPQSVQPNIEMREVPAWPGAAGPTLAAPSAAPKTQADAPSSTGAATPALTVGATSSRAKLRGTIKKSTAAEKTP